MNAAPDELDKTLHALWGHLGAGMSPAAQMLAWSDWAIHLATQPGHAMRAAIDGAAVEATDPTHDPRLSGKEWDSWPFSVYRQAHEAAAHRLRTLIHDVPGVDHHHEQLVAFMARQWLELLSPANCAITNPQVLQKIAATGGGSVASSAMHWIEDAGRMALGHPPPEAGSLRPGREVAVTPGKVILRNELIELIQYAPATPTAHAEPVLIVSAWIMKYYVLDLSPHNSLIRYLVANGHTVFAISWRNPEAADAGLGMAEYLRLGVMASLDAVEAVLPRRHIHAVGYCLGGTLMAIAAAAMARDDDDRLATLTLLAAQTDFTEPGELGLFIDESQLAFLDDIMSRQGYLGARQMAAAFRALRPGELVWAPMVRNYLLGERVPMTDLEEWNADGTRMPYRMHSDYLRRLFLENALAEGHYRVDGRPISVNDIDVPMFALGTRTDHVAPWQSVYKIHRLCDAEITFVLTEGGHNGGILSEPGHPHRSHRLLKRTKNAPYVAADEFLERSQEMPGSWWPCFQQWLVGHSGPRRRPPAMGSPQHGYPPIGDAPGIYVLSR